MWICTPGRWGQRESVIGLFLSLKLCPGAQPWRSPGCIDQHDLIACLKRMPQMWECRIYWGCSECPICRPQQDGLCCFRASAVVKSPSICSFPSKRWLWLEWRTFRHRDHQGMLVFGMTILRAMEKPTLLSNPAPAKIWTMRAHLLPGISGAICLISCSAVNWWSWEFTVLMVRGRSSSAISFAAFVRFGSSRAYFTWVVQVSFEWLIHKFITFFKLNWFLSGWRFLEGWMMLGSTGSAVVRSGMR